MESADLLPSSCDVKLSSRPIEKLPDSLLSKIFSYLPFADRYQLCFVSSKWSAASRIPWTDVTFLNLNTIPPAMVCPILNLCPKIDAIEATDLTVLLEKKQRDTFVFNENVRTMKLRNVKLALTDFACGDAEPSNRDVLFSFNHHFLRFPKLSELILHKVSFAIARKEDGTASKRTVSDIDFKGVLALPKVSAGSLRRFVHVDSATGIGNAIEMVAKGMDNLQCVYLQGEMRALLHGGYDLPQLRELCVISVDLPFKQLAKMVAGSTFPKLEVFICASDGCVDPASLSQLITVELPLRILIVAGRDELLELQRDALEFQQEQQQLGVAVDFGDFPLVQLPVALPPRQFPADSSAAPRRRMPPLEIFVGGDFTKYVRFSLPASLAIARFWRIDCPMPEFLAKPEVAEIFKDVFVAKIIRQGPGNGLMPWGHPDKTELFFSAEPLQFR